MEFLKVPFPVPNACSSTEQTEAQQDLFYSDASLASSLSCMRSNRHCASFDKRCVVFIEGKVANCSRKSTLTFLLNLVVQFVPTAKFLKPCNIVFLIIFYPVLAFLPVYIATFFPYVFEIFPCCVVVFFLINSAPFQPVLPVCEYVKERSKLSVQCLLICDGNLLCLRHACFCLTYD